MKTYDFTSKERDFGRVVFALTLDRKKLSEKIIIGRVDEVRQKLNGGEGDILYEGTRPLGSLLLHFESDINGDWNKNILPLCESYAKIFPRESARWKMVAPVQKFLTEKYNSGEPSAIFAAVRTWEDYLNFFHQNHGADLLNRSLFMLYKPFRVYAKHKPWQDESTAALSVALQNGESAVELWYPVSKRPLETVVASSSFLPIIFYYTHKISEWKFVFQHCKICDAHFLARSRHYELCSDECRKKKASTTKKEYDERTKEDTPTKLYETAYYYWYNRQKKLQKGKHANPENAAAFKVEFDAFRKEAVKRKAAVKNRQRPLADFSTWLAEQQNFADKLMDELAQKK
ncbi:MAG: hypothetical protein FWF81_12755 [Defluviitaleaceae bacterium]|nr:hypothetical protein [Defluviitaleaceae bacterium]